MDDPVHLYGESVSESEGQVLTIGYRSDLGHEQALSFAEVKQKHLLMFVEANPRPCALITVLSLLALQLSCAL
jgi:hypothetical protein